MRRDIVFHVYGDDAVGNALEDAVEVLFYLAYLGDPPAELAVFAFELEVQFADDVFFEAPCWDKRTGKLYFVAWGKSKQVLRLDGPNQVTVWLDDTENKIGINGIFASSDGRLLTAQVFAHKVVSFAAGKNRPQQQKVLAANEKWNQPNDLCQSTEMLLVLSFAFCLYRKSFSAKL